MDQAKHVPAQTNSGEAINGTQESTKERDGQHDFDWDIGTWKAHMRRLLHPLTGSATWVEYDGTDVVRKVWDGRVESNNVSNSLVLFGIDLAGNNNVAKGNDVINSGQAAILIEGNDNSKTRS
jgi:hypothetical protein